MTTAVAYLRTSSATNVGQDKDSARRQQVAIEEYAQANGITIVKTYYDAAVSGADQVADRPGFAEMMEYMNSNGARIILVENASRFARDLIVQETGYAMLKAAGYTLIACDDPDAFTTSTPTADLVRQVLGAVAQFEKANLVSKLKGARDRKRAATGRCEGRKPAPELARTMAHELHREELSLRQISARLADAGYLSPSGQPYSASSVRAMLA